MKKYKVSVSTGYVGSERTDIIEIEDDATEEQITEECMQSVYEMIDIGYWEVEDDDEDQTMD